jgi:Major coat protein-like
MRPIPAMTDMRRTDEEKAETVADMMPTPMNQPDYPYGLCISLNEETLEKLGLDEKDFDVGDMVHIQGMGLVTSKSTTANSETGDKCRIEIQITHLASENEDDENEEAEGKEAEPERRSKLYG